VKFMSSNHSLFRRNSEYTIKQQPIMNIATATVFASITLECPLSFTSLTNFFSPSMWTDIDSVAFESFANCSISCLPRFSCGALLRIKRCDLRRTTSICDSVRSLLGVRLDLDACMLVLLTNVINWYKPFEFNIASLCISANPSSRALKATCSVATQDVLSLNSLFVGLTMIIVGT